MCGANGCVPGAVPTEMHTLCPTSSIELSVRSALIATRRGTDVL